MSITHRRAFLISIASTGAVLAASRVAAQAAPVLDESDPQAVALGYKADNTKVDKAKYPSHTPDQMCSACQFYGGKASDASAPCQLFAGKQVMAKGWCSGFNKKA